jgi:hypothetical protein
MLRHIVSVSLAMTACATLIPTKVNAVTLTLLPVGSLQRNPGDSIEFILALDPEGENGTNGVKIIDVSRPLYDDKELSFDIERSWEASKNTQVTSTTNIARFLFTVLQGVKKDGNSDILDVTVDLESEKITLFPNSLDVQPVPEPLTILGAATALGYGAILKRQYFKNKKS